ncbi:AMP-binding protein [Leptolyngbya subtilissima ST-M1]|uniref:AMP-dependent synthetase/ligase n=1 Tax=Cyanophyceae TaxID=3028117 RepID=UPI0018EF56F6|nr:AMP-binding protein [Nodosilinea sp. FACHB-131]
MTTPTLFNLALREAYSLWHPKNENHLETSIPTGSACPSPAILHRTLPSLLDGANGLAIANDRVLNQWRKGSWQSFSTEAFRRAMEEFALGLETFDLHRGDRVALMMHSDVGFAIADLGTLLAGFVNIPIDLTQTIENILLILQEVEAPLLVISNPALLDQIRPYLWEVPTLKAVIVAEVPDSWQAEQTGGSEAVSAAALPTPAPETCLQIPHLLCETPTQQPCPPVPQALRVCALAEVREWGRQRWSAEAVQALEDAIAPADLATIIYIASETKRPKGVMLSHEAIAANVLASFSSYPNLQTGPDEVALLFLPLNHIFARVFLYGHLAWGHSIYFSDPNHLIKHLRRVKPTFLITVPRLLEKVHERILDQVNHLSHFDRRVLQWAINLTTRFDPAQPPQKLYRLQMQLAERLVFIKWREVFGGRLKACICGGAALSGNLVKFFSAAGVPVYQGYGLTETSGVLTYTRAGHNRLDTVGRPIPGVEIALAPDQEVLVRAPFLMQGYYHDPAATAAALTPDGWLHTGDFGTLDADGFLTITGVKKALFKLCTGKYVSPRPLEQELMASPLVDKAITVGANHKFCAMVIVPDLDALRHQVENWDLDLTQPDWWHHPRITALYQSLIDTANCHFPYWSTVRKFALVDQSEGLDEVVERLYGEGGGRGDGGDEGDGGEGEACPVYARSLMRY